MKARRRVMRENGSEWRVEALEARLLLDALDDWYDSGSFDDYSTPDQPVETAPTDGQGQDMSSGDQSSDQSGDIGDNSFLDDYPTTSSDNSAPSGPAVPGKPGAQALSATSVYLSWGAAKHAGGYAVARLDGAGNWTIIATTSATHFTDTGLTPSTAYSYHVVAFNEAGFSAYTHATTVTTVDGSDSTLVGQFGHLPGSAASAPLTFNDADGTRVTLNLTGPGVGSVHDVGGEFSITLTGTTLTSALKITTAGTGTAGDDGRFELSGLVVGSGDASDETALGSLSAPTTDLDGALTIDGEARQITLGNVSDSMLNIAGNEPGGTVAATISLGVVSDSSLVSGTRVQSLTAVSWGDAGGHSDIEAPSMNKLSIAGHKASAPGGADDGDFAADVTLGVGNTGKQNALGTVTVAGSLAGTWQVTGPVSAITADGAAGWSLAIADAGNKTGTLGSLNLTDPAAESQFTLDAAAVRTISVRGSLESSAITLRQTKQSSLNTLTVQGSVTGTQVRSSGGICNVTVGVLDHSVIFAGVEPSVNGLPASAADFVPAVAGALPAIKSLTLTGTGAAGMPVLIDSFVAAGSIGRVTLPKAPTAVADPDQTTPFGFATVKGHAGRYTGPASTGLFVSGLDSLVG